jgi:hypothetical protein
MRAIIAIHLILPKEGEMTYSICLSADQKSEGYRVEPRGEYLLLWHNKNQIALIKICDNLSSRVHSLIENHQREYENAIEAI